MGDAAVTELMLEFFKTGLWLFIGKFCLPVMSVACAVRVMLAVFPGGNVTRGQIYGKEKR